MNTADQKFINLIGRKLESNLNLFEAGSGKELPHSIAVPESTFEKEGFDRQDINELLKKFQFLSVITEYKIYSKPLTVKEMTDGDVTAFKAYDFFLSLKPAEYENLYVLMVDTEEYLKFYNQLFAEKIVRPIKYNSSTGSGTLRRKDFKLKDNQPEFFLFKELYESYNEPIKRTKILKILNHPDDSDATFAINDLAKKIRSRTGLTTKELVLNNGNITLSI